MSQKSQAAALKNRYLTFVLEEEQYGVEILRVKEIIGYQPPTHIPRTPAYVLGVLNLRGSIIPVIDLRAKLEMARREPDEQTAIIISTLHETSIGFVVDRVQEVASIAEGEIGEPPQFGGQIDTTFLSGVAKSEKRVIMLLDLERIFDATEAKRLEAMGN
ncbi:MAG: chemotaxis protein CheW [Campylobacterales bacterium]